jgi:hypothetical protein
LAEKGGGPQIIPSGQSWERAHARVQRRLKHPLPRNPPWFSHAYGSAGSHGLPAGR